MQAKDVPDLPVLQFLADLNGEWAFWFGGHARSVGNAMPPETPHKVVLAKMRQLMKRGLVKGCGCGCRGDFEITDEGRAFLASAPKQLPINDLSLLSPETP